MPITYNGSSVSNISYNGNSVSKVTYNGTTVFENIDPTDPNTRYDSKSLGTWSSTSDVDTFCSKYTHANNYTGLSLGNYVTISNFTYNIDWEIAGFDCEYNQTAADGTVYDNGYGIMMIPKMYIIGDIKAWSGMQDKRPYVSSTPHSFINDDSALSLLRSIVGTHIIQRNVLLGSTVSGTYYRTTAYAWTTAYLTLPSVGQLTGTFASNLSKYDDGEANYKLPLFNYENYYNGYDFWTRGVYGTNGKTGGTFRLYYILADGSVDEKHGGNRMYIRPLMMLR